MRNAWRVVLALLMAATVTTAVAADDKGEDVDGSGHGHRGGR